MTTGEHNEDEPKGPVGAIGVFVGVALAYIGIGLLARTAAVAPSTLAPIWPGAGLALAAVVLWGRPALAGVAVGMTALSLQLGLETQPGLGLPLVAAGAAGGGLVAATQAYVGGTLWGTYARGAKDLTDSAEVLRLMLFAGPVSCLIEPSYTAGILGLATEPGRLELTMCWLHLYLGNVAGVVLATPVTFALAHARRPAWRGRAAVLVPPLLVLTVVLLAGLRLTVQARTAELQREDERVADRFVAGLQRSLEHAETTVAAAALLLEPQLGSDEDRFRRFARMSMKDSSEMTAIGWNQYVTHDRRAAFEEKLIIRERGPSGELRRAAEREFYVPVAIIEPLHGNESAVGFDIHSEPRRAGAVRGAIERGRATASAPIDLVQGGVAVLLVVPNWSDPVAKTLRGFAVGVISPEAAFRQDVFADGLLFRLVDEEAGELAGSVIPDGPIVSRAVRFAGRRWRFELGRRVPENPWLESPLPTLLLAAGTALGSLMSAMLLLLSGRTYAATRRAQRLARINEKLEEEVAERERAEMELSVEKAQAEHDARHDPLTGLTNRRQFEERIGALLEEGPTRVHGLAFLDLDQFKIVNDTAGHGAGDALLREVAAVLAGQVRPGDTVARLGGDEFGILLVDCPLGVAESVIGRVVKRIAALRFEWEGAVFPIGVSAGLVAVRSGELDLPQLLARADVACYASKDLGGGCVQVYRGGEQAGRRHAAMHEANALSKAMDEGRLHLVRQPIVAVSDVAISHYEILLRVEDDAGNLQSPGRFIAAAERFGRMREVDRWVLAKSLAAAASWGDEACLSVNLSALSLSDADLASTVREHLRRTGVSPERLCIEITETAAVRNMQAASRFIRELREIGCRFALDDFGTGLSSFGALRRFDIDYLKIDGSFVSDIGEPTNVVMIRAAVELAEALGIRTIAEWVEDDATLQELRRLGVHFAQGWAVGRPEPTNEDG